METEEILQTIQGLDALKDKFREAKLKAGDYRGFGHKQRFELAKKFNITAMQVAFYSMGGNGENRIEVYADVTPKGNESSFWSYTIKELVFDIYKLCENDNQFEIIMYYCKWNKARTDADRVRVNMQSFIYVK